MENTNLKLLIVDDEQPILSALKSLLRKENYDIYTVDNPKEAIKLLQEYDWTGNIRELRNVVERLIILGGNEISETDVKLFASK